jgi:hypothetical protein
MGRIKEDILLTESHKKARSRHVPETRERILEFSSDPFSLQQFPAAVFSAILCAFFGSSVFLPVSVVVITRYGGFVSNVSHPSPLKKKKPYFMRISILEIVLAVFLFAKTIRSLVNLREKIANLIAPLVALREDTDMQ